MMRLVWRQCDGVNYEGVDCEGVDCEGVDCDGVDCGGCSPVYGVLLCISVSFVIFNSEMEETFLKR